LAVEKISDGMHLFLLENSGILFSETRQQIHILNTSAAVIWCHLEDGKSAAEIIPKLRQTFDLNSADAKLFVTTALNDWRRLGFLEGDGASVNGEAIAGTDQHGAPDLPEWTDVPFFAERSYRLLSSRLRLRFSRPEQETIVHPVLAHLACEAADTAAETLIDIISSAHGMVLYRDREPVARCDRIDELAPVAKGIVWNTTIRDHSFFLDIHAGVVCDEQGGILLPAPPGSGKSTLTAALVSAGFQFFSDEVALLEETTFNVFPVPLALCFKDTGLEMASRFFPQVKTLPIHNRGDGKRVCYMPPPAHALPASTAPKPVKAVVFPQFQPGASSKLDRMDTVDALKKLMDECLVVDKRLDRQKVAGLIDWIGKVDCYRLVFSDAEDAVRKIKRL